MYFTLAVSAATPDLCAALADRARIADPAVMPIPGPAVIAWRSPDGRAALLHWGRDGVGHPGRSGDLGDDVPAASHAGTIWTGTPTPGSGRAPVYARTSITRVDPVYVAEVPGAVIVADRASWAASTASRLDSHDPLHICALLNPGFPLGTVTPFTGVSALSLSTTLHLLQGDLTRVPTPVGSLGTFSLAGAPRARPSVQLSAPSPGTSAAARSAVSAPSAGPALPADPVPPASPASSPVSVASSVDVGLSGLGLAPAIADHDVPASSAGPARPGDVGPGDDRLAEHSAGAPHASADRAGTSSVTGISPVSGRKRHAGANVDPAGTGLVGGGAVGGRSGTGAGGARAVAEALVAAVAHLGDAGRPVELSLTGGKDSRLVAAALVAAGVPVVARTHGFADHPDVVVAAEIARRLGIEHIVRTPAAPGQQVDVLGRIRATVLVADGMLSAFENVGRPDPAASPVVTAGGHGGELLRGGYAETAVGRPGAVGGLRAALGPARRAARSVELLRRLTTKHLGLLRRGPAAGYVASLTPWTTALARGPLVALDDFYLVNRAGRWSAAARQAYLIRENLVQPLFDEHVVAAARAVPLVDRVSGALSATVLAELCPAITNIPLAGKPPTPKAQPPTGAAMGAAHASFDWRRQYGETIASFLHDYTLDLGAAAGLFDVVSRPAAEKILAPPHADRATVWALATLACLLSGDYRRARDASPHLTVT